MHIYTVYNLYNCIHPTCLFPPLTAGLDYASVADIELIFNADNDRVCIALEILGDDIFEGEEEFFARLTTDNPDVTLDPDTTTITIEDVGGEEMGCSYGI